MGGSKIVGLLVKVSIKLMVASLIWCGVMSVPIWARTSLGEKRQQAESLRKLIRTVDQLYLSEEMYPLNVTKLMQLDVYLAGVVPQISVEQARWLQRLRADLSDHKDLWQFRQEVLKVFEVSTRSAITPNYDHGKRLYEAHCAACHGVSGGGDGPLASRISHYELSLVHKRAEQRLSTHLVYNLLLAGLDSGLMVSYEPVLSQAKLWNIAFYTATLVENCSSLSTSSVSAAWPLISYARRSLIHPFVLESSVSDGGRVSPVRCLAMLQFEMR